MTERIGGAVVSAFVTFLCALCYTAGAIQWVIKRGWRRGDTHNKAVWG